MPQCYLLSFLSGTLTTLRGVLLSACILLPMIASAQGGPPYFTNDPGTPGPFNWEINVAYMPFLNSDNTISHTPDLDINFGIGDRIQLTYENAWLRVQNPGSPTKFGLGQSNPGVKWRFHDAGEGKLQISIFPQFFLNNPNNSTARGITPSNNSFLAPIEFSKNVKSFSVDFETGYQEVRHGSDGWIAGLIVGRDVTKRLEMDAEFFNQGTFHDGGWQPILDVGGRYKLHNPIILLVMAGRSVRPTQPNQPYFVGYFGLQFLLPSRAYKAAAGEGGGPSDINHAQ
jgi:hypothetical protein